MNLSFFKQRIYQSLKRKGLAPQFERAGIYAILLDGKTVYIGKSVNMLARMAQQGEEGQRCSDRNFEAEHVRQRGTARHTRPDYFSADSSSSRPFR